jgi:hypothetical protein
MNNQGIKGDQEKVEWVCPKCLHHEKFAVVKRSSKIEGIEKEKKRKTNEWKK